MNRERNKEYTKRKIIESAIELFSIQDYQKTSLEEISKKAGVTKTTFFAYFKTKEELLYDFDLEQLKVFEQRMELCVKDSQELLSKLREAIVDMAKNLHKTRIITQNLIHLGTISPVYKKLLSEIFNILPRIMYKTIQHGQEIGVITKNISPMIIGENLVKIYIGVIVQWSFLDEANKDLAEVMDDTIKNYISGIEG
ncbi:TetR/AcrR family transcriptional regulator [Paenibacillus sp. N3.4]|uniref:TetR/AcrR family transcriptional regulator n=1 Tax=Paenibacillus sp. N3.4 TaxID=2603222 RepID=UPI001650577A|nr:TetR/AcrR family transcriptional regulator [Paenibacillus sp. N3.4]